MPKLGLSRRRAPVDLVDGHSGHEGSAVHAARLSQAVLGTVTVGLVGLVAAEGFGAGVGLVALALAAVYPALIALSAVLTGLAALTHEDAIVILIPLVLAFATITRGSVLARAALPAALLGAAVLTIAPWTIRNAVLMRRLIPISDEAGITLVGTYNAASAANPRIPYQWRIYLTIPAEAKLAHERSGLSEPALGSRLTSQAFDYVSSHPAAPLAVAFHNALRLLELEGTFAWRASAATVGINSGTARIGVIGFWIVCALAIAGVFTRRIRAAPSWLWLVPLVLGLTVVLVNAETPRFREPLDPFLILAAACALTAGARFTRPG